jgi:hypothetical protein
LAGQLSNTIRLLSAIGTHARTTPLARIIHEKSSTVKLNLL